jgi:predicted ATPase/DNA-binding SARP family transcriptional activator
VAKRSTLIVRVLGPVTAERDGSRVPLGGVKPRLALALLAMRPGRPTPVEVLIDGLWGEDPPPTARKSLQVHVSSLRKALGAETIVSTDGTYQLIGEVDAERFESMLAEAGRVDPASPMAMLSKIEEALLLWRGEPYADLATEDGLRGERARLEEMHELALTDRLRALLELGRHQEAISELEALTRASPYREELRGLLMLALYRSGRQADALRAYQDARRILGEDLGIEPSRALNDLEQRILEQDPTLEGTAGASPTAPSTLPARHAGLVGREADVRSVVDLLGASRLTTILGVGGAGKTSLAVEAAHAASPSFGGGSFFVDLTSIEVGEDVLTATIDGVGLSVAGVEPGVERLVEFLGPRRCLLVMDNCEHVLDGVATMTSLLLGRCPDLVVLTTSREAVSVPGEHVYRIPLLEADGSDSPAVELFLRRAKEADSSFELGDDDLDAVVDVCRSLDGIPLAIELAASQTRYMSIGEIESRLADRFRLLSASTRDPTRHHQTLLAAVEWSHSLLDDPEQVMLRRLAVFRGGFDLADVAAVTGIDDSAATPLVLSLTAKSMVSIIRIDGSVRRRMLETIRIFAEEKLREAGEVEAGERRHFEHFIGSMRGTSYNHHNHFLEQYKANERELSNLIAAVEWGIDHGEQADAALTVARVYWQMVHRGVAQKYQHLLDDDYELAPEDRALLLTGRILKAYNTADPAATPAISEEARKLDPEGELDDSFFPRIGVFGFAPVEGAEARLVLLDELLPRAERSPTPDANVSMVEMQRAGQFYSLGRLDDALASTKRGASRTESGGIIFWDQTMAEVALLVLLGRREEARARLTEIERVSEYEFDLIRAACEVGAGDPTLPAAELARSARRHVSGRIPLQEGDYLCLFAAFRAELGDRDRAESLLDSIELRFGVIQWLVWPFVGQWSPEQFVEQNTKARNRELERMQDRDWDPSPMAGLLTEEVEFWEGRARAAAQ